MRFNKAQGFIINVFFRHDYNQIPDELKLSAYFFTTYMIWRQHSPLRAPQNAAKYPTQS